MPPVPSLALLLFLGRVFVTTSVIVCAESSCTYVRDYHRTECQRVIITHVGQTATQGQQHRQSPCQLIVFRGRNQESGTKFGKRKPECVSRVSLADNACFPAPSVLSSYVSYVLRVYTVIVRVSYRTPPEPNLKARLPHNKKSISWRRWKDLIDRSHR